MMNDCHNWDAYLDGEMSLGEAARFAAHLDTCGNCRESVDQERWVDGVLRDPAFVQLQVPPPKVVECFRGAIARRTQVKRLATGAVAAAVCLVAVGWILKLNWQVDDRGRASVVSSSEFDRNREEPSPSHSLEGTGSKKAATFVGGPDVIVVPIESTHPDVTIVRIYPVFQPDTSDQVGSVHPSAGDDLAWPEVFNGG